MNGGCAFRRAWSSTMNVCNPYNCKFLTSKRFYVLKRTNKEGRQILWGFQDLKSPGCFHHISQSLSLPFSSRSTMFVYIMDGVEALREWSNNRPVSFWNLSHDYTFWITGRQKQVFLSLLPVILKVTSVDFTKESTSISVESTFKTLIIEIDIRLYQYSCVDFLKR